MQYAVGSKFEVTANRPPHTKVSSVQFAVGSKFKVTANRPRPTAHEKIAVRSE